MKPVMTESAPAPYADLKPEVILDAVDACGGQRTDGRLLALSIISAFFLPLTFVTGLLGMNLAGIPYHEEPWSFGAVVAITLVLGLGLLVLLKWRRWI